MMEPADEGVSSSGTEAPAPPAAGPPSAAVPGASGDESPGPTPSGTPCVPTTQCAESLLEAAERHLACGRREEARSLAAEASAGLADQGPCGLEARLAALLVRLHAACGEFNEALQVAEDRSRHFRSSCDRSSEAIMCVALADVHKAMDRLKEALRILQHALLVFRGLQDVPNEVIALRKIAVINLELGTFICLQRAGEAASEALMKVQPLQDLKGEAAIWITMSNLHLARREYALAYQYADESAKLSEKASHEQGSAEALQVAAVVLTAWKDEQDFPTEGLAMALEQAKQAAAISKNVGDGLAEISARRAMASVYRANGKTKDAIYTLKAVLGLARGLDDIRLIDAALGLLVQMYVNNHQTEQALMVMSEEARMAKDSGSARRKLSAFQKVVALLLELQRTDEALDCAREAREILESDQDQSAAAGALQLVAETFLARKSFVEAVDAAKAGCTLAQQAQDIRAEADLLQLLSNMQAEMGQDAEALESLCQKHLTYHQAGWKDEAAAALLSVSELLFSVQGPRVAIQKTKEAIALYQQIQDTDGAANAMLALAGFQLSDKKSTEAVSTAKSAQSEFHSRGDHKGEADALVCLANVYLRNGVCEEAVTLYQDARRIYQEIGDRASEATVLQAVARLLPELIQRDVDAARPPPPKHVEDAVEATGGLLDHFVHLGDVSGQLLALTQLSRLLIMREDGEAALRAASACYQMATELDDAQELASALLVLAEAHRYAGDMESAQWEADEAAAFFEELGEERGLEAARKVRDGPQEGPRGPASQRTAFPLHPEEDPATPAAEVPAAPEADVAEAPAPRRGNYRARWTALMNVHKEASCASARRYSIVGTWDVWQVHDMQWNAESECFEFVVVLGSTGSESFKILLDGDWDKAIYPDVQEACPHEQHRLLGPDGCPNGGEWTIGRQCCSPCPEGTPYKVGFFVSPNGDPVSVRWDVLVKPEPPADGTESGGAPADGTESGEPPADGTESGGVGRTEYSSAVAQSPESLEDID